MARQETQEKWQETFAGKASKAPRAATAPFGYEFLKPKQTVEFNQGRRNFLIALVGTGAIVGYGAILAANLYYLSEKLQSDNNGGANGESTTPSTTPGTSASPEISAAPTGKESSSEAPSASPEASQPGNPEWVNPIKIESTEEAAKRFGIKGTYSAEPKHWFLNEYGGATLTPNPDNTISQVNLDGAVAEGWIKPKKRDSKFDAITIVAHPNAEVIEVQGATLWDFGAENAQAGFKQVLGQVRPKEAVEQPGVLVLPICEPNSNSEQWVNPIRVMTVEIAAKRFGADAYSRSPRHWFLNEYGGATLIPNPNNTISQVNLDGAVFEGWIKPKKRDSKFDAITIVAHPNVELVEAQGGTVWDFGAENARAGFKQVLGQVRPKEAVEQPGVLVLAVNDCTLPAN